VGCAGGLQLRRLLLGAQLRGSWMDGWMALRASRMDGGWMDGWMDDGWMMDA